MDIIVPNIKTSSLIKDLQANLGTVRETGKSIGFVPTMGALHEGHLSLVESAKKENDFVVVSIFVNPTQFNNPQDLERYPRMPEKDVALLERVSPDLVFLPMTEEIYGKDYKSPTIDLGNLDKVMEGKYRPGHFQGVVEVVNRFFEIVQPNKAYFGKKDFQQVAVIKHMTNLLHPEIAIQEIETLRDENGLALSSRNMLLTDKQRVDALILSQALRQAKSLSAEISPIETKKRIEQLLNESSSLELEYFDIVHPVTLESLNNGWCNGATACVAAYCGQVRLIDNMQLI